MLSRRPTPGDGEVLIRVAAAGINRPDIVQREGKYPPSSGSAVDTGARGRRHDRVDHVWPLIALGAVKPVVYRTFALGDVVDAHRLMESSEHISKIVLAL